MRFGRWRILEHVCGSGKRRPMQSRWVPCGLLVSLLVLSLACTPRTTLEPSSDARVTATSTLTSTPTATTPATASATPTLMPEPSATREPSPAPPETAVTAVATLTPTSTPTPEPPLQKPTLTPDLTVTDMASCDVLPEGPFLDIWQSDPSRQATLGCPTSLHPRITPAAWEVETAYQPFENGAMVWSSKIGWYEQPVVYVLYPSGTYRRYEDHYQPGDPALAITPPAGLVAPSFGFGKIWDEKADVRDALGWATAPETPGAGRFQLFTNGAMLWLSQRGVTYVFATASSTYTIETTPGFAN